MWGQLFKLGINVFDGQISFSMVIHVYKFVFWYKYISKLKKEIFKYQDQEKNIQIFIVSFLL